MRKLHSRPQPLDQAHGLRRLFEHAQVRFVPLVSNPHVAFGGVMLERLCSAFAEQGKHMLMVDASEQGGEPSEMALMDLSECIEGLAPQVSYLAARGLPLKFVDAQGSTRAFLQAVADAAPHADVVLVHASAAEHCRLFARGDAGAAACPLLLADDRPASVTHAYAALKLLTLRAGLVVYDLLLGAAPQSPRAERIAQQLASCADMFAGAVLRDWAQLDPASDTNDALTPALLRMVRERLAPTAFDAPLHIAREPEPAASAWTV